MANRFSDIKRAARLKEGLDNYINYLQNLGTRPTRIGQLGPRNLDTLLYVQPFLVDVGASQFCSAQNTSDGFNELGTYINASAEAAVTDNLGANELVQFPRFRAARIVMFRNATRSVTVERSDVTNLEYLKYAGTRLSCAFGATADTDDQINSFADVKAGIIAGLGGANEVLRVSLSREYVGIE